MQTIVFIETNKSGSSREAIKAAERLGYLTVLFTNRKRFLKQRTEFPDVHQMYYVDGMQMEQLRQKIRFLKGQGKQIMAVLSFIDPFVHIAARLSEEFSPSLLDSASIRKMEDKIQTRMALKGCSLSPSYTVLHPKHFHENKERFSRFLTKSEQRLPLIVKSPVSTGSKDVLLAETRHDLKTSLQTLSKAYPHQPILIEEYLQGPQYLVEILVHNDQVHVVAVIQQEISKQDRFIVTGYGLLAELEEEMEQSLLETAEIVAKAFNIKNGACHLELKRIGEEWKLIEVNPRISGGVMNRLIETGFGINLVEETIQLYLGKQPDLSRCRRQFAYAHYMTVRSKGRLNRVTGKRQALDYEGVEEVYIKPRKGMLLTPPLSMGHRYAYVLAAGETLKEAKKIAENAAGEIQFHLHPIQGEWR
jgi:biotin carboxylase